MATLTTQQVHDASAYWVDKWFIAQQLTAIYSIDDLNAAIKADKPLQILAALAELLLCAESLARGLLSAAGPARRLFLLLGAAFGARAAKAPVQ